MCGCFVVKLKYEKRLKGDESVLFYLKQYEVLETLAQGKEVLWE